MVAAALTAAALTGVTVVVDHGRGGEPVFPELSSAVPKAIPPVPPAPVESPSVQAAPETTGDPAPGMGSAPAPQPVAPQVRVGRTVVFLADYESGDLSRWGTCQSALLNSSCGTLPVGGDRAMQVVAAATPDGGRHAARFTVRRGDVPEFGGGERSEVADHNAGAATREGDERWYEWSMRFPENFTDPSGDWFIVMQWHAGDGSPPLAIEVSRDGTVDVAGSPGKEERQTIGPVRRGEWVNYVLHARFSNNHSAGFVEAWENGRLRVPKTARATMSSGENYLKQGIYRDGDAGDGAAEVLFSRLRVTAP